MNLYKKGWALGLALCLTIGLFSGCGGTSSQEEGATPSAELSTKEVQSVENQVVVAISTEPETGFDPIRGWGTYESPLIQSTLLEYDSEKKIIRDAAKEFTIEEDGLTWNFILRDDVMFTNGTPLTSEDVAFTYESIRNSATTLDLSFLDSIEVVSPQEIRFHLKTPMSTFAHTVTGIGIVPKDAYTEEYANNPIGSGPWKFVEWSKGEQLILQANQDYYRMVPAIDRVVILFMEEDAALAAAQSGAVDVALTSPKYAHLEIPTMTLQEVTTMDNRGFTLPVTPNTGETTAEGYPIGNNVTSQPSIRQALACGIDREQLVVDALEGYGSPSYSENDGMPWNNPDITIVTDVERAKQILEADGWQMGEDGIREKAGQKAEFGCYYLASDSSRQAVAMAAAQQAKELGIHIDVIGASWDEISQTMFSQAVLMGWGSTNPYTSYLLYHSSNKLKDDYYNPEGFDNAMVDQYLDRALEGTNEEDINQNWQLAQWDGTTGTSMKGETPWVWLVNLKHLYFVRDGLDIGEQQLHAHGASWTLLYNLKDWKWIDAKAQH